MIMDRGFEPGSYSISLTILSIFILSTATLNMSEPFDCSDNNSISFVLKLARMGNYIPIYIGNYSRRQCTIPKSKQIEQLR